MSDNWPHDVIAERDTRIVALEAENAELRQKGSEALALLEAIYQTVDPEDGDAIVCEAYPSGAPRWVLDWAYKHANEGELIARAAPSPDDKDTP